MAASSLVGLIATALIFLIEVIAKHYEGKENSEKKLTDGLVNNFRTSVIFGAVVSIVFVILPNIEKGMDALLVLAKDAPEFSLLLSAARARETVDHFDDPVVRQIFSDYLKSETDSYLTAFSKVAAQKAEVSHEMAMNFGESAFAAAGATVDTTSFVAPASWWLNPDGNAYFLRNEDALKRGVRIRRIFIYREIGEKDLLRPIIAKQKAAGVDVYTVAEKDIPNGMSRDIIIVDNKLVGELIVNRDSREFGKVIVNSQGLDIKRVQENWDKIQRLASRE